MNHWRHIVEGREIHIRTDHASLSVYRQKKPMTRRLGKFMEEIEHYDPQIGYRPGRLQTVPDALSRIPGQREEGEPASAERFLELGEGEGDGEEEEDDDDDRVHDVDERARNENEENSDTPQANGGSGTPVPSMKPKIRHDTTYYESIRRYLRARSIEEELEEKIKEDSQMYEPRERALFDKDTGIRVVMDLELFEETVEAIHKDLGHYGKKTTLDAVADRYIIATDIWSQGAKELDACVPCQLYKPAPAPSAKLNATIHPHGQKRAFDF